jgi:hypothetical protein
LEEEGEDAASQTEVEVAEVEVAEVLWVATEGANMEAKEEEVGSEEG